jgi:hypothetical protein
MAVWGIEPRLLTCRPVRNRRWPQTARRRRDGEPLPLELRSVASALTRADHCEYRSRP